MPWPAIGVARKWVVLLWGLSRAVCGLAATLPGDG